MARTFKKFDVNCFKTILNPTTLPKCLANEKYVKEYPELLLFFKGKKEIKANDLVVGAHMVYGWMPTILNFDKSRELSTQALAQTLNKLARGNTKRNKLDIENLVEPINNSLVGTSKLLHFAAPSRFAIWDSKICGLIKRKENRRIGISNVNAYLAFLDLLDELIEDDAYAEFHQAITDLVGYEMTSYRSLELAFFLAKRESKPDMITDAALNR